MPPPFCAEDIILFVCVRPSVPRDFIVCISDEWPGILPADGSWPPSILVTVCFSLVLVPLWLEETGQIWGFGAFYWERLVTVCWYSFLAPFWMSKTGKIGGFRAFSGEQVRVNIEGGTEANFKRFIEFCPVCLLKFDFRLSLFQKKGQSLILLVNCNISVGLRTGRFRRTQSRTTRYK